jgi:hypothetical protein
LILRADRPILVGIDNPHSADPRRALMPMPTGSAGWRLWKLSGMPRPEYLRAFQRVNACDRPVIPPGSRVVVLGREAWGALGLPFATPLCEVEVPVTRTRFTLVPHPSGRNLWYNDEDNRQRVGDLLRGLARQEAA